LQADRYAGAMTHTRHDASEPAAQPVPALLGRNAFSIPAYRRLWLAAVAIAFSMWLERLAIGWVVLEQTGSPFLAALTFAVRMAPSMVVGPFAGALADRVSRPRLMVSTALARALLTASIAMAIWTGFDATWVIMALVAMAGVARMIEMPAEQALIVDIVGRDRSTNAIGLHSVGTRSIGLLGAFAGGVIIDLVGAPEAFLAGTFFLVVAGSLLLGLRVEARPAVAQAASLWRDAIAGVRALLAIPVVAALLVFAVIVEILAFSFNSLLPVVARDVLDVGPSGLGALGAAAGAGSVVGSLVLSTLGRLQRRGALILGVTFAYGTLLFAFGQTDVFRLALVLVAGVGAMAAMFDALQWILLQVHVPDEMRGRALGGWVWAIGFGWVGPVVLGAIAEGIGVPQAFAISGSLVVALAIGAALLVPGLRRA
jgi:MFS transporter, DHA1 family, staphyloferrin A biosynthesis exporter